MVNIRKCLINVVTGNKPKMLTGLSQKALWRVEAILEALSWTLDATGEWSGPNPSLLSRQNTVSPISSVRGRQP